VSVSVLTFWLSSTRVGGWIRVFRPETVVPLLYPAPSAAAIVYAPTPSRMRKRLSYAGHHRLANFPFNQKRLVELQIILVLVALGLLWRAPSLAAQDLAASPSPVIAPPAKADAQPAAPLPTLSLADAEARALHNQPRLAAETLRAEAMGKRVQESRSAYFPQLAGNLTAVKANGDTAVAAGAVTTSSTSTRVAGGFTLTQLVTDFGRTSELVRSSRLTAQAASQHTEDVKLQILRDVDQAYFATEAAESVRGTAQAVLAFRQTSLRQLTALAQSQLRSTLDVQFAQVLVSEAQIAVVHADSAVQEARAQLAATMGEDTVPDYALVEQSQPPLLEDDVQVYIREAITTRPDLKALKLQAQAAQQFAKSESKLNYPDVNLLGTAGEVPERDHTLEQNYGAAGINIHVPVFNGGLYSGRAAEARLRALAVNRDVSNLTLLITRDVRTNWAQARDAYLQIQVTRDLVDQTAVALRLAQARYDAGLGSIVELNQAELSQTSALISAASARFDYLSTRAALNYTLGILR
jgi:outer membrane protein